MLWDNVEKCGRARKATDDNIISCMHFACWVTKARDTCRILNICGFCTAATFTWTNRLAFMWSLFVALSQRGILPIKTKINGWNITTNLGYDYHCLSRLLKEENLSLCLSGCRSVFKLLGPMLKSGMVCVSMWDRNCSNVAFCSGDTATWHSLFTITQ